MNGLGADVRHALRVFRRNPGSTLAVVFSLALGVGPNVVVFSAADAVLLRPLPFEDPDRLVVLHGTTFQPGRDEVAWFSQAPSLESVASYVVGVGNLSGGETPEVIRVAEVSASIFRLLGVSPRVGRAFTEDDEKPGARVALVTSGLWWRSFGADVSILGKAITIGGQTHTVVGVLPSGVEFPNGVEAWVVRSADRPFGLSPDSGENQQKTRLGFGGLLARLKPGVAIPDARDQVITLQQRQYEELKRTQPNLASGSPPQLHPLHEDLVGKVRPSLFLLLGGAAFVLLIALANAAHLLLERSEARRGEIAIRAAIGAGRARLVRQLLVESLLRCLLAAAVSLVLARWGLDALRASLDAFVPAGVVLRIDGRVFGFALATSLVTGLLAGLAPAWHAAHTDVQRTLQDHPGSGPLIGRTRGRGLLVVGEVAAAVALLVGAGLMVKSLALLQAHTKGSLGFRPEGVVTFEVSLPRPVYTPAAAAQFRDRVLERLRTLPGVQSAAATDLLPYGEQGLGWFQVEGAATDDPAASGGVAGVSSVTPEYLAVLDIPLREGRPLAQTDAGSDVALVSDDLARRFWPGQSALGHRLQLPQEVKPRTIVGVVGRVRAAETDDSFAPPQVYVLAGARSGQATFVVHTRSDPSAVAGSIRAVVASIDKTIPPSKIATMDARVAHSFAPRKARSVLLWLFAGLAALLASLGIYAVMAYAVTLRTREFGIRQALGAGPREILRLVLGQGARLTFVGVCLGLLLSVGLSRLLVSFLFKVQPVDLTVYSAVAAGLALVALAACYLPVRRALQVDPATSLRYE